MDDWALWGCSLRLADEMERQQEKWRDLAGVTLARQQTCSVKRMNEFAGLMDEAREAQIEAMLLARRRSKERRRGEGNENKRLMEEEMAAYGRVRAVGQEALREATVWIEGTGLKRQKKSEQSEKRLRKIRKMEPKEGRTMRVGTRRTQVMEATRGRSPSFRGRIP